MAWAAPSGRGATTCARAFAGRLPEDLGLVGVVVVGSVARGDFHDLSDVDVVVAAVNLPAHPGGPH